MASASVQGYDEVLKGQFAVYKKISEQIGGDVKEQSDLVKQALDAERAFLVTAAGRAKPSQDELTKMLEETSKKMNAVEEFRNKNRGSKQFNHLSSVSEGIGALGWVVAPMKPDAFVKEKINAAEFYTNRVLKDFKDQDAKHADWVKAFLGALKELEAYTKKHHSAALTWGK
ncbi:adenylyl cyclase-associated protein 1-like isoform X1 [Actinia tenebrosa]|uniref:Adenylyl cyclase-associated protein 1-like isoform X1 n=1 Tax=Actinia tenebrosa TaxID=6105 RepID=A0A6P8HUW0_ACTTE|nr:adenylyl cyclase-associated protein 1-like isoform X1 [Actinia tenebrosa]